MRGGGQLGRFLLPRQGPTSNGRRAVQFSHDGNNFAQAQEVRQRATEIANPQTKFAEFSLDIARI